MAGVTFEVNAKGIKRVVGVLEELTKAVGDTRPAMREAGAATASLIDQLFRDEVDPYGKPWKEHEESTKKQRKKGPGKGNDRILDDSGVMAGTAHYQPTKNGYAAGVGQEYSKWHQDGTKNMVQRLIVPTADRGLPEEWADNIIEALNNHLRKAANG